MIPNQVYKGQRVQFRINPAGALDYDMGDRDLNQSELPIQSLSLGDTLTDWSETIDSEFTMQNWWPNNVETVVTDQRPSKNVTPRALFRSGDSFLRPTAKHWNFAGDEWWYVRSHPVIDSIGSPSGYTTGGQELDIYGFGFNGQNVEVQVDGTDCRVTDKSDQRITCKTGTSSAVSKTGYQPGQPGLIQTTVSPVNENHQPGSTSRTNDSHPRTKTLLTTFETSVNKMNKDTAILDGWFKAPETGEYRFYISGDDVTQLYFKETPFNADVLPQEKPDFTNADMIASRNRYSNWR